VEKDIVDNAESFRQPKEGEEVTLFGVALPQAGGRPKARSAGTA